MVLTEFHSDTWVQPKVEFKVKCKEERLFYANVTEKKFCKMESAEVYTNLGSVGFPTLDNSVVYTARAVWLRERTSWGKRRGPLPYPGVLLVRG